MVEQFRDYADVLIATEAAAEGVNLQFCSLVVNYDLPWNPQRIEQRIGRCHRYGQTHDVVVVNFLNRANAADQRVFELLSEKFRLFDGVFGSSDEVLGALESGVDFERRIADIYQTCRTAEEIDAAFCQLQKDLEEEINARMTETRTALLEHFDEEVHTRLRMNQQDSRLNLDKLERCLWNLTKYQLQTINSNAAVFDDERHEFDLRDGGIDGIKVPAGRYRFITRQQNNDEAQTYRLGHPLAEKLIELSANQTLPPAEIVFDYTNLKRKVGMLEPFVGESGWLLMSRLNVSSLEDEDRFLCAVVTDNGKILDSGFGEKLFQVPAQKVSNIELDAGVSAKLQNLIQRRQVEALQEIGERNNKFFDEEIDKLERWADDLKHGLEAELKELDVQIKQAKRDAKVAPDLQSKLELQRTVKNLENTRNKKRRES